MAETELQARTRRFARRESDLVRRRFAESVETKQDLLADETLLAGVTELADVLTRALRDGGKALLFGNGGSAADATHLAAELVGRYKLERDALPALSLSDNVSSVTAIGNDYAYDVTFARQIQAFGREGDVAIGLSTSGRSANVLRGLQAAGELGLHTVAVTGAAGPELPGEGPHLGEVADLWLAMPTNDTPRVQECTMLVGHTICELVERAVFTGS